MNFFLRSWIHSIKTRNCTDLLDLLFIIRENPLRGLLAHHDPKRNITMAASRETARPKRSRLPESGILVDAEAFDDFGGWVLDSQFLLEMGSPYLLAHGNGIPVADATTRFYIAESGLYNVWVRTKDWVPGYHPGRFAVSIDDVRLGLEFGANDRGWSWQSGGQVELKVGYGQLRLHDLTGFGGRCDAIFFTKGNVVPPDELNDETRSWRRRLRGLPESPVEGGSFDVVVVGGGVVGAAAALTAARLGDRVALVHNRPCLGGNASMETGLRPRGVQGPIIEEIHRRKPDGDLYAYDLLLAAPTATVFLDHTVYETTTHNLTITAITAREARTGKTVRLRAPVFIDCSGRCILGLHAGAKTMFGQESKAEHGESLAPALRDNGHHGNTVFFRTREAEQPHPFPPVPWATAVAKDFADLGGQLERPGVDNGPGPRVLSSCQADGSQSRRRMELPLTHYWEYGQHLDPYTQGEHIRDHLLRAIYGTFSNVKAMQPEKYANLVLDWVAFVPATGEFRRYKGDYVLTETDIREHRDFPDMVVQNDGAFCLHYPGHSKYDFRLRDWKWDERDGKPYGIPFRCLYSVNISNLMMAGKHISVTHVAGSNTKFMGNGAQHAIATAAAAHLCIRHKTTPKHVYQKYLSQLQSLALAATEARWPSRGSRL